MCTHSRLRSLAKLCFIVAPLLWIAGCGGGKLLLNKETISKLAFTTSKEHRIIYFDKSFTYDEAGKLFEKTHQVIRVGENATGFSRTVTVHDNSINKLLEFEARVIHSNGDVETFSTSELTHFNLSSKKQISESYIKSALIRDKITTGDFVEIASIHECTLPMLGITFSLAELDYAGENITCSVDLPANDTLQFILANDDRTPTRKDTLGRQTFAFKWKSYTPPTRKRNAMEKRNQAPALFAVRGDQSWKSVGDWNADLFAPKLLAGPDVIKAAHSIADGKQSPKEKLDAIFEYCQRNVRYEIVFLEKGEIIPNNVDAIFARKYGDCKDYATLMHAMAKTVGVNTDLAYCFRGRGKEFYGGIPVDQFNHVVLHYEENGKHYWYDGTNRVGLSGVTTFDLANAQALVINKGNSQLVTIAESPDNLLSISGTLRGNETNGLTGDITVELRSQFAIDFFWMDFQTNHEAMTKHLTTSLQDMLNEDIIARNVAWKSDNDRFIITATCEFPNSVVSLQGSLYTAIARVLPELLPREPEDSERDLLFYFPYYNNVNVAFTLEDFIALDPAVKTPGVAKLQMKFSLPAGPFDKARRSDFLTRFQKSREDFTIAHKLTRKSS